MVKLGSSIPAVIGLSDGIAICDSSGQQATDNPRVKQQAEILHAQFQRDLFRYQSRAEVQGIHRQEQVKARENFSRNWNNYSANCAGTDFLTSVPVDITHVELPLLA